MKGLSRLIRAGLVAGGLAVLVGGVAGCTFTPEEEAVIRRRMEQDDKFFNQVFGIGGAVGLAGAETQKQAMFFAGLKQYGEMGHAEDVAEKGRAQMNVNVYGNPGYNSRNIQANFFSCNYFKDFNGDGIPNYEEFVGIKNSFRKNEGISLISLHFGAKGKEWRLEIYDPQGKEISSDLEIGSVIVDKDEQVYMWPSEDAYGFMNQLLENFGGLGSYKAVWYLDNKVVGMHEFEIVE